MINNPKKNSWYLFDHPAYFFFFRVPPSFNMLKIQAGEQEKSEIYIYVYIYIYIYFFVLGALQCIRAVICACKSNACKKN